MVVKAATSAWGGAAFNTTNSAPLAQQPAGPAAAQADMAKTVAAQ